MTNSLPNQQQTEAQLQRTVEQLQLALSALDGFIYDYDMNTNHVERSEGLTRLLGYERETIPTTAEWWSSLTHPDDLAVFQLASSLGQAANDSYSYEYRVRHQDGQYIYVWDRAILIRDSSGNPMRLIGTTINITERKQAEERQRYLTNVSKILADSIEYETRLTDVARLTLTSMADWCVINMINDADQIYTAALAHRDPEKEQLLRELCDQYPINRAEADGTALVLRTGESQWYPIITDAMLQTERMDAHELALWKAIGYHSLMIVPLIWQSRVIGTCTMMLSGARRSYSLDDLGLVELVARRITIAIENARLYKAERIARAAAEQAAARAAFINETGGMLSTSLDYTERLNNLVHFTVPRFCDICVVFLCTADGSISRAAAAHADKEKETWLVQLQKLDPIDPRGLHPAADVIRTGQTSINPDVSASLGQILAMQMGVSSMAPKLIPRDQVIVPLVARQHVIGAIAFGMDASNREFSPEDIATAEILASRAALMIDNARLYQNQQEAVNVRDAFLLIASHELKTPLTAVLGQAQLLQQRFERSNTSTERDLRAIRVIVEQSHRLNKLISTLLDVSRLSQGQLQIIREPVNLNQLIQRVVGDFQPLLVQHTIAYQELDQQLLVNGDVVRLEQVLQNLLQNALKYSPQGGTISVTLESRGAQALITVSDKGIGIPKEAIPSLFQRFYRVHSGATQHMSGIGVGLYVVREIVTLHDGNIFVESTEGQGSSFMVALPLIQAEASAE